MEKKSGTKRRERATRKCRRVPLRKQQTAASSIAPPLRPSSFTGKSSSFKKTTMAVAQTGTPPEVVTEIFLQFQAIISKTQTPFDSNSYDWIGLSQVCTYWRAVAHNCPQLWACIHTKNTAAAATLLQRSRQAQLQVTYLVAYGLEGIVCFQEVVAKHLPRVSSLYLEVTSGMEPILAYLDISRLKKKCLQNVILIFRSGHVPLLDFYGGSSSSSISFLQPRVNLFHAALKTLHIHYVETPGISNETLLRTLAVLPLLEYLAVSGLSSASSSGQPSSIVCLPHIKGLIVMNDDSDACTELLSSVCVPPTAEVVVKFTGVYHLQYTAHREVLSNLASAISQGLFSTTARRGPTLHLESLDITFVFKIDFYILQVVGWNIPGQTAPALIIELPICRMDCDISADCALLQFCGVLAPPTLRSLTLDYMPLDHPEDVIPRFLQPFQSLEKLSMSRSVRTVMSHIDTTVLPALKTVVFSPDRASGKAAFPSELIHALEQRRARGIPIQEVVVQSHEDADDLVLHALREVVQSVKWVVKPSRISH
ncbi:hypothetical protein EIP91_003781 [Steccherinum ochraceum]|uniref:Uncharacterized protein n=1 Tax=Steccherinum ochraceum TaxID=92696 RepID=A0A4R0RLH7_9APHY|nr:hypothetical protein EIP91_003781 [Steccherinum ochraceum]